MTFLKITTQYNELRRLTVRILKHVYNAFLKQMNVIFF